MTPVETLRKAAADMRAKAEAATPGPWRTDYVGDHLCIQVNGWDVATCYAGPVEDARDRPKARANRDYLASWHPAVALAVADWLDIVANGMDLAPGLTYHGDDYRALAVARAYLGEQP